MLCSVSADSQRYTHEIWWIRVPFCEWHVGHLRLFTVATPRFVTVSALPSPAYAYVGQKRAIMPQHIIFVIGNDEGVMAKLVQYIPACSCLCVSLKKRFQYIRPLQLLRQLMLNVNPKTLCDSISNCIFIDLRFGNRYDTWLLIW